MTYVLTASLADETTIDFTLQSGRYNVGSDASCEIRLEHEEIPAVAARIDVRGAVIFVLNRSPWDVYVGDSSLPSKQEIEWPEGHPLLLTRNVSLSWRAENAQADEESEKKKQMRSWMQVGLIGICLLASYAMLTSEQPTATLTSTLQFDFTDLVKQLEAPSPDNKTAQQRTILNYLIDARVSDLRWAQANPARAIDAYELLLDQPRIRTPQANDHIAEKIREYALARVNDLSASLGAEP